MDDRLPAHLEAAGIRRLAESMGGFATILSRGERDAGTIGIVIIGRGEPARLYERMPQLDGNRPFVCTAEEDAENKEEFSAILERRRQRDPDLWLIEADVPERERFVAGLPG
ncbi:DUF1491 family protein [Tsuneonella dongtanensis]|uniref:DUF1491 family protein n=1 Tax=Tsuneonella dongtanensis TaxID=692370 RepID=UPI0008312EC4|nr:DUF1491 family protein [Tsuneonella dongtanensis]